jgi:hypothetical protein
MVAQRLILAKIAGKAGTAVVELFRRWMSARTTDDRAVWTPEQWPAANRELIDRFGLALQTNGDLLPVVYCARWIDLWSMAKDFHDWLAPPELSPLAVVGDRFELWCYPLPDEGRLAARLAEAAVPQFQEEGWFRSRVREALDAWGSLLDAAAIVLLREVIGGLANDRTVAESVTRLPGWLADLVQ